MRTKILDPKWLLVSLLKEEKAHCLILRKNPVWGTPGTILRKFYTQIHGRGSSLTAKQDIS